MICDTPFVSIVCLVYNHEPYLRECFEGFVMQQTTFPIEILVHDDASTDHSADIIREYTEKYPDLFKPIYQTENQYSKGVDVFSENAKRAEGKYIAICEGDDYWTDPLKLQKQVDFLEEHEDVGLVATDFSMCEGFNLTDKVFTCELDEITFQDFLFYNRIGTLTVCYRKSVVNDYVPPIRKLRMGDYPLWLYIAYKSKIRYLHCNTACYRVLNNSASHPDSLMGKWLFEFDVIRIKDYYATLSGKVPIMKKFIASMVQRMIDECYTHNLNGIQLPLRDLIFYSKKYSCYNVKNRLKVFGLKSPNRYVIVEFILKLYRHRCNTNKGV